MIVRIPYTTIKKVILPGKSDESSRDVTKQWSNSPIKNEKTDKPIVKK
jgi:hypothetical protein